MERVKKDKEDHISLKEMESVPFISEGVVLREGLTLLLNKSCFRASLADNLASQSTSNIFRSRSLSSSSSSFSSCMSRSNLAALLFAQIY